MSPNIPLFVQVLYACNAIIFNGITALSDGGCLEPRYSIIASTSMNSESDSTTSFTESCTVLLPTPHVETTFCASSSSTMTTVSAPKKDLLLPINWSSPRASFSGHGNTAVTMSPNIPLFVQVLYACNAIIFNGITALSDGGCLEPRYSIIASTSMNSESDSTTSFTESCTVLLPTPHVETTFCASSSSTMTTVSAPKKDLLLPINWSSPRASFSGHGNTAVTMSPNIPLFVQVSHTKYCFRSDDLCLLVLPCPRTVLCCFSECMSLAGLLLKLSGDVEENPGPVTEAMIANVLQNQKEILSKLTEVQTNQASSETRMLEMQNRLLAIEQKLQSFDDTQLRLTNVEAIVDRWNDGATSLVRQVDDLDNRSRRNNLIIRGMQEGTQENDAALVKKVTEEVFRDILKVQVTSIERIHRLGKKTPGRNRPIIFRLADFREKVKILSNCTKLKDTEISISEDYSRRVVEIRKRLWDSCAEERKEGRRAKLVFDKLKMNNVLYGWDEDKKVRYQISRVIETGN
ncbi:uncharacterized protein LOC119462805 [Dermacentor silvarum]|uniref:uncharacterized protein LOC119462805 n=1 Tax=Dermacentor silvarum TaxID=543639 RepID=UPI002101C6DA|nr:uncharacterized protein LOC119462805 [Dermacentor silvarum]